MKTFCEALAIMLMFTITVYGLPLMALAFDLH
jgi:hypothetical protein